MLFSWVRVLSRLTGKLFVSSTGESLGKEVPPPPRRRLCPLLATTLLILSLSLAGCGQNESPPEEEELTASDQPVVEVATAEETLLAETTTESGEIAAAREAALVPSIPGEVERVEAEEGDYLDKGELIFQTESTEPRLQLEQAQSALNSLEEELDKMKKLEDAGALPASQIREMETELEQLESQRDMAQYAYDSTRVEAPMDGILTDLQLEEGQMVGNEPVGRFMDTSTVKVRLLVDEGLVKYLSKGMPAEVEVPAADRETTGEISRVGDASIEEAPSYPVEVKIDNLEGEIRPGMFARVQLSLEEREGVKVHSSALREDDGLSILYLVEEDRALEREVIPGARREGMVEIVDGLAEGERYVVSPPAELEDEMEVEAVEAEEGEYESGETP